MIGRFLGAVQFLTVLPVSMRTSSPGSAAIFFPLVGCLAGMLIGTVVLILERPLGRSLAALLAIATLVCLTGGLHEDGLADVADAVRAGRSRDRMTDILKDSRIGTYGAAALIFSICLRWQLIAQVIGNPIAPLAATLTLSRASMIALAGWAPSVGAGLGREFAAGCTRSVLIAVIAQSIFVLAVAAGFIGLYRAGAMIAMTALVVWCARVYFTKRLGGVNGDCLGATCQAVEIMSLLVMAWQPSS